jgi:hypothetical protein
VVLKRLHNGNRKGTVGDMTTNEKLLVFDDSYPFIDLFLFRDSFQSVRPELVEGLATSLS